MNRAAGADTARATAAISPTELVGEDAVYAAARCWALKLELTWQVKVSCVALKTPNSGTAAPVTAAKNSPLLPSPVHPRLRCSIWVGTSDWPNSGQTPELWLRERLGDIICPFWLLQKEVGSASNDPEPSSGVWW